MKKMGKYDVKILGYASMITVYDVYNKKEATEQVKYYYGKVKIDWISPKIIY